MDKLPIHPCRIRLSTASWKARFGDFSMDHHDNDIGKHLVHTCQKDAHLINQPPWNGLCLWLRWNVDSKFQYISIHMAKPAITCHPSSSWLPTLSCQVTLRIFQSSWRPIDPSPGPEDSTQRNSWMFQLFQPIMFSWPWQRHDDLTLSNGLLLTFTFQCCSGYLLEQ